MSKALKTINKEVDKGLKKLDANTSKAIGMNEGDKISHALNVDSEHHKDAVKEIKGHDVEPTKEQSQLTGENVQHTDEA
jgi:hypothetical protein